MSGRIVDFQKSPHQATQELLPWFASDTLAADEHGSLAAHLESCAECRLELETLRRLQAHYVASDATADAVIESKVDVESALARLRPHISPHISSNIPPQGSPQVSPETSPRISPNTSPHIPEHIAPNKRPRRPTQPIDPAARETSRRKTKLPWQHSAQRASLFGMALAAQFGVIVALGWVLWTFQNAPAPFHALGAAQSPARAAGDAVIVFSANIEEREMRQVLQDAGARIVDGPTATNGYVIRFERGDIDQAIVRLSSDPAVHLVARLRPADG